MFCNLYGAFKIKFYFHASLKLKLGALRLCPNGDFFQVKKSLTLVPVMFMFFFYINSSAVGQIISISMIYLAKNDLEIIKKLLWSISSTDCVDPSRFHSTLAWYHSKYYFYTFDFTFRTDQWFGCKLV